MKIDAVSTFPDMLNSAMNESIMKRAQHKGMLEFYAHDLRDWTHDRHRTTDDEPYGGGPGLLMKAAPIFEALDDLCVDDESYVIIATPAGKPFVQVDAEELSRHKHLVFVCGHYEGMDERVYARAHARYSIGDYVLTGGELPTLVMIDAIVRLLPGVLGDDLSVESESFSGGLLEYPQYTRPEHYRDLHVPPVLLSGDHARIASWRRGEALLKTAQWRPDLLAGADISDEERMMIQHYLSATEEK